MTCHTSHIWSVSGPHASPLTMHTALSVLKALFEHYNFYSVVTTIACSQHPANSPLVLSLSLFSALLFTLSQRFYFDLGSYPLCPKKKKRQKQPQSWFSLIWIIWLASCQAQREQSPWTWKEILILIFTFIWGNVVMKYVKYTFIASFCLSSILKPSRNLAPGKGIILG